jgi:NTP pyrophosphatase (non-canonical NTP hydrolase)
MAAGLTLAQISDAAEQISQIYAEKYGVDRDRDWALLKVQEELGELTQAHLRLTARGRGESSEEARGDEAADVLCMLLIYCRQAGIDIEAAVQRKWLSWLQPSA